MKKLNKTKRIEVRITDDFFKDLELKIEDSGLKKAEYFRYILSQIKLL